MRYLRLYLCFLRFSAGKSMEFRLDFFFRIVMDLAYYGVALGFFHLLYLHTPTVAGWDLWDPRIIRRLQMFCTRAVSVRRLKWANDCM